jgi:hypothetical protein
MLRPYHQTVDACMLRPYHQTVDACMLRPYHQTLDACMAGAVADLRRNCCSAANRPG